MTGSDVQILPNLGAEEGEDWQPLRQQPRVRVAARLWSHLFGANATLCHPALEAGTDSGQWVRSRCADLWPPELGPAPEGAVHPWLEQPGTVHAWLATPSLAAAARRALGASPAGPDWPTIAAVHDKAFALEAAREAGLLPRSLAPLLRVLSPDDLRDPDALLPRLEATLRDWPAWTRRRFTLKPRQGSSGRGRVGGRETFDTPAVRGALPRLAARGGAILEPWLERTRDLSVSLWIPPPDADESMPVLLGSLEALCSAGGGYRGHCGEVDSRGRVFSGCEDDEVLREAAALVTARAAGRGFHGPCGVDGLAYLEAPEDDGSTDRLKPTERLRPVVELNARPTMGWVALGLVRRALPLIREPLELMPGERRGFLLVLLDDPTRERSQAIAAAAGADARAIRLASDAAPPDEPVAHLFFARRKQDLLAAYHAERPAGSEPERSRPGR